MVSLAPVSTELMQTKLCNYLNDRLSTTIIPYCDVDNNMYASVNDRNAFRQVLITIHLLIKQRKSMVENLVIKNVTPTHPVSYRY